MISTWEARDQLCNSRVTYHGHGLRGRPEEDVSALVPVPVDHDGAEHEHELQHLHETRGGADLARQAPGPANIIRI